ncbi:MAG: AAA family ATPase, partial [candidate division Zixibacteria bacterium]|nr:AAA family ATPase [candidate division Zixibacteria bacterium]
MILKRIRVKSFKAIKEKNIEFSPGLNIIKGSDNEAGKSSLRQAILKAL